LKKKSKRALCVFDVFRQISVWNKFKENTKKTYVIRFDSDNHDTSKKLQKITIQEDKLIKKLCTAYPYKIPIIIIKDLNENYKFKMHIFTVK